MKITEAYSAEEIALFREIYQLLKISAHNPLVFLQELTNIHLSHHQQLSKDEFRNVKLNLLSQLLMNPDAVLRDSYAISQPDPESRSKLQDRVNQLFAPNR